MKVAEVVANWIATVNPRVYSICGAGAMHLNDAICHHPDLKVTAMHHEQAATFAAEADSRVSGLPGIVSVTCGPGGTNTITGLAAAYVDSIPLIVIAGQVPVATLHPPELRQMGMNELDLVAMVKPVTKYAVTVKKPEHILHELNWARYLATDGRKGPVFVEIPLDVQAAEFIEDNSSQWCGSCLGRLEIKDSLSINEIIEKLTFAKRPVIIIGNGIRLGRALDECRWLVDRLNIPIISSWGAIDVIPNDHQCYIGRSGVFGDRAGNFTVQNSDLVLAIGTRLSIPQTGYAQDMFAPHAKKIVVDIDCSEATKLPGVYAIQWHAKVFLQRMLAEYDAGANADHNKWLQRCRMWKSKYPVMLPEYRDEKIGVNSYFFVEQLAKHLPDDAIVVTDVGAAFLSTMQSLQVRQGQRLFHSGGVSAMGYGLPAAIGACVAGNGRKVVCLTGDGGLMMNVQELQTISHHQLPIAIFVFANNGYLTIQAMQENHFKRQSISSFESGVSCPDFTDIARAFGIPSESAHDNAELSDWMHMHMTRPHPFLCQIHMPRNQVLKPRVQSRMENGKFIPTPIDDMWPYLEREEMERNRSVKAKVPA